jgi:hypothetical protein
MEVSRLKELPLYECFKQVHALKIRELRHNEDGTLTFWPVNEDYQAITVEKQFVPLHDPARPSPGWYFVVYENEYKSFSPAEAFEKGYRLLR